MSKNKIDRFRKKGLIGCLNTECHKTGCKNLETQCKDCGRIVNTTEIPMETGNAGWISVEDRLPEVGEWVLIHTPVNNESLIEIAMLDYLNRFINPQMGYGYFKNVSHWMPLPPLPEDCNCAICDEETRQILDETYNKPIEN